MSYYDNPDDYYSYEDDYESDDEELDSEEWELLNNRWERESELAIEIGRIPFNEETDVDELRFKISKLVHEKYPKLFSEDISDRSQTFINLLKYLESPECSVEELREYLDNDDKYIRNAIAYNINCDEEMLEELRKMDQDAIYSFSIANNKNCSPETLAAINSDEIILGRIAMALNPKTPESVLKRLTYIDNIYKRLVSKNPSCNDTVYEELIDDLKYYSFLAPYILISNNCSDYLKCYLIDKYITENEDLINYLDNKINTGLFSQLVIDFIANSEFRNLLSQETNNYLDLNKSNNKNIYEELFKDLLTGKEYPKNTLNFELLNGHYNYLQEYKQFSGLVGIPEYEYDYYGDDGLTVMSRIRELGTREVAFGESPISLLSHVEWWAFKKAMDSGLAIKTGKTYRNIIGYKKKLYEFDEYDYNGFKVGVAEDACLKIEPVIWKLEFNKFVCMSKLYSVDFCPKELVKLIPTFLSEDLVNVDNQCMEEDNKKLLKLL